MHVLYEDSGSFKSGTILADNDSSLQVEAPHGKRSKVKAASVLLRFDEPPPAELMRAAEAAAVLLKLHSAPVYFHRKGKGRYRAAPPDTLKAALAGQERKRRQQEQVDDWAGQLQRGELPDALRAILPELLYRPDRNKAETKALEQASEQAGESALKLLERAGAVPSTRDYHFNRFLFEQFAHGAGFPEGIAFAEPGGLTVSQVRAFSLDDAATTEIDDA